MIVQFDLVCTECGITFTHHNRKRSHAEADAYRVWAHEHITMCPDCFRAQLQKEKREREMNRRMIPFNDFLRLLNEASTFPDIDQYIAECGGSVPLDDADEAIQLLHIIWSMGSGGLTIDSIFQTCERTMRNFAITYHLPVNTVQNWHFKKTQPPVWQLPFLAYAAASDYFLARL